MSYDTDIFDADQVDIYYYDEAEEEWIAQEGTVKDGTITIIVDHFSTYGVFAKEKEEDLKEDPEKEDPIELPKDAEEIDYVILHENGKEKSTANSFFVKPGYLFEKDGKTYVQVTITNGEMVKELKSEHGEAVVVKEHDDGSIDVQFRINSDLSDTLLEMRIVVPGMYDTEHKAIFSIDEDKEPLDPSKDPKPEPKPKPEEKSTTEAEKVYAIDYIVKHATDDEASAADGFFVKPGHILEKDGKKYLQVTINNWDMINWLKYNGKDVLVAKVNKDGSALVQLKIDGDLSDVIELNMSITVPGVYENQEHDARLILNPESMKELDEVEAANFVIYDTPEKPSFGSNDDNGDENGAPADDKPKNPQTGDTSGFLLYLSLLFGSALPLIIQIRRRFAKA